MLFQRKTKTLLITTLIIGLLLSVTPLFAEGKQEGQGQSGEKQFITIGTASPAGAYYPLGVKMADIWNRSIDGINFTARETGGSVNNMNLLNKDEIQVGFGNENIIYNAIHGEGSFSEDVDVQGGWVLNQSMAVFVAIRKSGITHVTDLEGKKVALGKPGSSANVNGQLILNAHGLEEGDYEPVYMGWQEAADALQDKLIDAALMVGGQPFPAIESLSVRTPINVLSFDIEKVREEGGFPYGKGVIPQDMYDLTEDGDALALRSLVCLSSDLSEDLAYEMVKTLFNNIPALKDAHSTGDQAALMEKEYADNLELPIHTGVIKYAKDQNRW